GAANFDLLVLSSQKFDVAVLEKSSQVTGPGDDIGRVIVQRVRNKYLLGEVLISVITQRAVWCPNVNLPDVAFGCRPPGLINYESSGARHSLSDGHRPAVGVLRRNNVEPLHHGGLARTIQIAPADPL